MKKLFTSIVFVFGIFATTNAYAYFASVDKSQLTQGECLTLTWSGFGDTCNIVVYKGSTPWTHADTQANYAGTMQICSYNDWELRNDYKIRVEDKSNTTIYIDSETFSVVGPLPYLFDYQINGGASSTTSRNVSLQFNYTTATPTHYMASENSNFSGSLWTVYSGSNTVWFTLSDYVGMKFVYFKLKNSSGESSVKYDNISYSPIMYYDISGYVLDDNGQGISDVEMVGSILSNIITNSNGYYIMENVPSNWFGTITPTKNGYSFSPSSKTYSGITDNMTNQNYAFSRDYHWNVENWGECCESCNGGRKSRPVQCIRASDNEVVLDQYCTETKPDEYEYNCSELDPSHLDNEINGETYTQ